LVLARQRRDGRWEHEPVTGASSLRGILVADLNNDRLEDLLLLGDRGVLLADGQPAGDFQLRDAGALAELRIRAATTGDVNGDGWPDLYLLDDQSRGRLWLGDQNGGFLPAPEDWGASLCCDGSNVLLVDLDGDGDMDLAAVGASGLTRLRNQEQRRFQAEPVIPAGAGETLAFGDIDGDGKSELLAGGGYLLRADEPAGSGRVAAFDLPGLLDWADLDSDGRLDLVAQSIPEPGWRWPWQERNARPAWFRQTADSRFEPGDLPPASSGDRVVVSDMNGDGRLDLVVAGERLRIFDNTGPAGHWLSVRFRRRENRALPGTRVALHARKGQVRTAQLVVNSKGLSRRHDLLFFGLGETQRVHSLEVFWASGRHSQLDRNVLDRYIGFVEPSDASGGNNLFSGPTRQELAQAKARRLARQLAESTLQCR
ncbi:MAG: CRTAC1 family protein, partial [Gammaproteobacteria bacterium]|nr:CRTAC1 family protein [Gammaproteobacteria bacterium]